VKALDYETVRMKLRDVTTPDLCPDSTSCCLFHGLPSSRKEFFVQDDFYGTYYAYMGVMFKGEIKGRSSMQSVISKRRIEEIENMRKVVRFQVLMAACMKMIVFWVVAPCRLVEGLDAFIITAISRYL
jgi:hypothetical protein